MYHECKLVHADLSEYNILYHDSHLYIIDVSQSVEHDHPHAFDFLRNDVKNVEDYFGRRGVATLGLRRCFEFVTRETFESGGDAGLSDPEVLKKWLDTPPPDIISTGAGGTGDVDGERMIELDAQQEDSIFLKSYIPRTLNEVYDPERDLEAVKKGGKTIYSDTIGIVNPKPEATALRVKDEPIEGEKPRVHFSTEVELEDESQGTEESDEEEDEEDQDEGEEESEPREKKLRGHRHEDKEAKKVMGGSIVTTPTQLTGSPLGTQESCEGGTTREAQSQDAQVREEETDEGHHNQAMSCTSLALSAFSPAARAFSHFHIMGDVYRSIHPIDYDYTATPTRARTFTASQDQDGGNTQASVMHPRLASDTTLTYLYKVPRLTLSG